MLILMRYGSVETNSVGCLLVSSRDHLGSTLNEVLDNFGRGLVPNPDMFMRATKETQNYSEDHGTDHSAEFLADQVMDLFGSDNQSDDASNLYELGFDFCPEGNADWSKLVVIYSCAEQIIAEATLIGLDHSEKNPPFHPDQFWWEQHVKLPEGIKAF